MSEDGWEAEELPWNNLATLKAGFFALVEGVDVDEVPDDDVDEVMLATEAEAIDEVMVADTDDELAAADVDDDIDGDTAVCRDEDFDEPGVGFEAGVFPFTILDVEAGVTGREPNVLRLSCLTTGVAVGEDETGAVASSIEPKFKEEPCFTEPTLFRGTLTPSFTGTPWPNALGRREWEAVIDCAWGGAGD